MYESSLGGSFVGLLIKRANVHMNYGIIGSSDMDQDSIFKAKLKCKISIPLLQKNIKSKEYQERTLSIFFGGALCSIIFCSLILFFMICKIIFESIKHSLLQ